jgi:hypothetical protein
VNALASNEVEARNRARDARKNAEKAGVTGKNLDTLKAAENAAQAIVRSKTGGDGNGGITS